MREVLSYSRRGSRFTPDPGAGLGGAPRALGDPRRGGRRPGLPEADWFGREAPLIVEIGSGIGEATAVLAAARPDHDVLALEVWRPGVADTLWRLAEAGADNVRLCSVDAVWVLEHLVEPGGLAELWTFFPDPWPKTRHHKRRLVDPAFAALAASRLAPGSAWRLATDWAALRRADARGAGRGAAARRGTGAPLGRPAGHQVRAQGGRGRPGDRGPGLRAPLNGRLRPRGRPAARTSAAPARPGAAPGRARGRAGAR